MYDIMISFDTARLAKRKGFVGYGNMYNNEGDLVPYFPPKGNPLDHYDDIDIYYASTQSLLQAWLREKHEIHVEIFHGRDSKDQSIIHYEVALYKDSDCKSEFFKDDFDSYEHALEIGLQRALILL